MEPEIEHVSDNNAIKWNASGTFGTFMAAGRACDLCGKNPGEVYRKVHRRENGLIFENSRVYCKECDTNRKTDCDWHFDEFCRTSWEKCEEEGEKNWQEHGIYTNVGGKGPGGLSTHFGYIKLEDGTFKPYRFVHPADDRDRLEAAMEEKINEINNMPISEEEKFLEYKQYLSNLKVAPEFQYRVKVELEHLQRAIVDYETQKD